MHYAGPGVDDIHDIYDALPTSSNEDYKTVVEKLNQYFSPQTNVAFEVFNFRQQSKLIGSNLELKAANGTTIPYLGWIEIRFRLDHSRPDRHVVVPILVAQDSLEHLIIGYNVIEEVIKDQNDSTSVLEHTITSMKSSFPTV